MGNGRATPVRSRQVSDVNRKQRKGEVFSEDEISQLLAECPQHLRRILECGIYTGMRRGENLSIKWEQIRTGT
jgi:integrase